MVWGMSKLHPVCLGQNPSFLPLLLAATDKQEEKMFNFVGDEIRLFLSPRIPASGSGDHHTHTACVWQDKFFDFNGHRANLKFL